MAQKPSIPKGTRDFGTVETARRKYIFNTIENVYQHYGFQQIETPAMENLSTLMGKYGEEGDKLLFKILNSGDFLAKADTHALETKNSTKLTTSISKKGLRYDLTVPFARFVVQHQNEISFPFKRYQIQPVWRADRPQKGRYQEFFQCDADVIGSKSLLNEVELLHIINDVFAKLGISVTIKLNNRKILAGIAEMIGYPEKMMDITVALDKLDKIGKDKVLEEMRSKDINDEAIQKLEPVFDLGEKSTEEKVQALKTLLVDSETGMMGIEEIEKIQSYLALNPLTCDFELDLTLARGLNYYTGAIIEVVANDVKMGSICGGGRYDDLTGIFGLKDMSGVGISFGADRIYDVLGDLNLFPSETEKSTEVLLINFGGNEEIEALKILKSLRDNAIKAELYPDSVKMKKQFSYADKKHIPWVIMAGDDEIQKQVFSLKNMQTGDQKHLSLDEILKEVKS
jgi:histidyl-tRNA synthetase